MFTKKHKAGHRAGNRAVPRLIPNRHVVLVVNRVTFVKLTRTFGYKLVQAPDKATVFRNVKVAEATARSLDIAPFEVQQAGR